MKKQPCGECGVLPSECDKCGKKQYNDPERAGWAEVPPPYGSLNAAYPLYLCTACNHALAALVFEWIGTPVPPSLRPEAGR